MPFFRDKRAVSICVVLSFTARIEGAHSDRAASASKKGPLGGRPAWSPTARVQRGSSETARCASTGEQQDTLSLPYQPNAHR